MNASRWSPNNEESHSSLSLAVVGLDGTGEAFARAGMLHPSFRLVTVADPRPERGAAVANRLGVPFAPAYLDVLNDPTLDGLVVAGDMADHAAILAEAAVRGRTVLATSPAASTLTRLDDLILTASEGGARVACPNPWRVVPATALAARQLREPGIGQLLAVFAAHRTKQAMGDPLVELGLPLLDYLVGALRAEVVQVQATAETLFATDGPGEPDTWLLLLRFRTGLIATVELGRSLPAAFPTDSELRVEFAGSERVVVADAENLGV
ncbi:MAG: Gfo/Idh/MocA family oxidoreductase, partial [Chloroflexota bacterium]|nr:Gfo/Idh/MocA family oxidoreductase [Chloroflexota bacterium]